MIPELTPENKLDMSLSQIRRYEKKYKKLKFNNRYYIQYYGYDVALHDWKLERPLASYENDYLYASGTLENGNSWKTSPIVKMEWRSDHYKITTESNTIYRLYF
jgi:hypothetical protein